MRRAILSMVWLAALAHAAAASAASLDDPLPGHPGVTEFDLARLIVPDLKNGPDGATGHKTIVLRHIDGKDALAPPEDPIALGSDAVDLMAVPGRPDRILALIDLGASDGNVAEATVLGLYELTPKPRLLDAVEVGNDQTTGMESKNPPMLAPGSPLIAVDSGHSNSNESFNSTDLIFVRGDRLARLGGLVTFNQSFCAFARTQDATYRALPAPGPYASLEVSVRETTKLTGEEGCTDQPAPRHSGVQTYQGVYTWDAGKAGFVTHSKPLAALPDWLVVGASTHWSAMASFHTEDLGCAHCLHNRDDPGDGPIPTNACVSFWAGLLTAAYLGRHTARQVISPTEQQIYLTPFRPEHPFRSAVLLLPDCPTCRRTPAPLSPGKAG